MPNFLDVLVIGAGPVGLFCANELARQGLQCRIVDKKSELSDKSKALALHIRSLDLLEDCGLLEEILAQGFKIEGLIVKSKNKILFDASLTELKANRHYLISLPQSKIEQIFYKDLNNKGVAVEWNTELTGVEQRSSNVIATLRHADGSSEQVQASWLIACDGIYSTLRKLLYSDFIGGKEEQTWWLADLFMDWEQPQNKAIAYLSEDGPLACLPFGNKRYRLVMSAPKEGSKDPNFAEIEAIFQRRATDKAILSEPFWLSHFGIVHKIIKKYRYGRVFFAGDAAHVHSPVGGQGLNTGLQDIYNLAWKLALVQKGFAKEELLDSYHVERFPIAKNVLRKTSIMTSFVGMTNPFLINFRNRFMQYLGSFHSVKKSMLNDLAELDLNYASSSICAKLGQKTGFKLGEYLIDFSLTNIQNNEKKLLHHIIQGNLHHLFLFTGPHNTHLSDLTETARVLETQYQGLIKTHLVLSKPDSLSSHPYAIWLDANQEVHKAFGIQKETVLMLRPDKYVSLTQSPFNQKELLDYLEKSYVNKNIG